MALLINGAGGSAADPILDGLEAQFVFGASTFDVTTITEAWLDQDNTFAGTNSVKSSLTPAATVLLAGTTATYDDTLDQLDIGSTTGMSAGDAIYLSHASITDGLYLLASVVDGTKITLDATTDPFAGGGAQSAISFQCGWSFVETIGTAPIISDGPGDENFFKARVQDASANQTDAFDSFWARNAPSGSAYVALDAVSYTGQTFTDADLTLAILASWTNNGGISHVELANHSVQTVNNFTWTSGGGIAEKTFAAAETSGISADGGDGAKYGRFLFKTKAGGTALGLDFDLTIDTAGPTIVFTAFGA